MAGMHLNHCPKRNDRRPISVLLLPPLCYAFLGQKGSRPHEKSHRTDQNPSYLSAFMDVGS